MLIDYKKYLNKLPDNCKRCGNEGYEFFEANEDEIIMQCTKCQTYFFIPYEVEVSHA